MTTENTQNPQPEPQSPFVPPSKPMATPPGWHPDPAAPAYSAILRWWDGAAWTEHIHDPSTALYAGAAQQQPPARLAPNASAYNPFIWVVVLLPVISVITLLSEDLQGQMRTAMNGTTTVTASSGLLDLLSFVLYGASVLFSYFDYRRLGRQGFAPRFHWAWSFLTALAYLIGRTVQLRKQAKRVSLVLWVYVALLVVTFIITIVKVAAAMSTMTELLQTYPHR